MATATKTPENKFSDQNNPGQDEFDKIIDKSFSPGDERMMEERAAAPEQLAAAETKPAESQAPSSPGAENEQLGQLENQAGPRSFYKGAGQERSSLLRRLALNRIKAVAGGAVATILVSLTIFFLTILPLKILHIVQNFQDRFFASSQNAIGKESEKMFSSYLVQHVMPGLNGTCPSTRVSRSCVAPITGTDPISKLYDGWYQGRVETKLYEKYGIEIARGSDGKLRILSKDLPGGRVDITRIQGTNRNIFDEPGLSNREFRSKFREAFADETRVKKAFLYYKYGGFLDKKYKIRRCLSACTPLDRFTDKVADKKLAGKAWLAQRVLEPRSAMLGLALQCVLSGGSCDPDRTIATDPDTGQPISQFEADLQTELQKFRDKYGNDKLRELVRLGKEISEKGYSRYAIEQVISKVFGKTVSGETSAQIADALPIVGWLNNIVNTADFLQTSGPKVAKMTYVINSTTMVAVAGVYGTAADEMRAGDTDATELGSLTDTLGPTADGPGAEASPLYGTLVEGRSVPGAATASSGLLGSVAYAATVDKTKIATCNNGNPVPTGKLVCPELRLDAQTTAGAAFGSISNFLNLPVLGDTLSAVIGVWKSTIGGIISRFGSIVGDLANAAVPSGVKNAVASILKPFMEFVTEKLVPAVMPNKPNGARTVDLIAGGFDVSGNDCAHYCIGGQKLSNQQLASILSDQADRNKADFDSKPLLAKLFDTKDSSSMMGRIILRTPSGGSLASMLSGLNPFKTLSFASSQISAAAPIDDPFGVTQYGYPVNDPIFKADPQQYWNDHCVDDQQVAKDWNDRSTPNVDTGMPENNDSNPCLLLRAAAESAGAIFPGGLASQTNGGGAQTDTSGIPTYELLSDINGYTPTPTEAKNIKYIADSILPLLQGTPEERAALAARVTWWSLKEHVLDVNERPTDPIGYSNCGGRHIDMTAPCSASLWQVGIAAVQVNDFSDETVESTAQRLHPGMSIKDILASVAKLAGLSEGSPEYNKVINSTGVFRRSFLLRDPSTGFTLVDTRIRPDCINAYMGYCKVGDPALAGSKETAAIVIAKLKDYFSSPTGTASATIDMARLYDSSENVACASQTKDLGIQTGYHGGQPVKIRICALPNLPSTSDESHDGYGVIGANGGAVVNSRVSGVVYAMVEAAKKDRVVLTANSSFRSMAHQQSLCPCDGVHVGRPGYSNHQMGLAIDFGGGLPSTPGPIPGNAFWEWLSKNAGDFGYKNYPVEAWHWSPTGN